MLHLGGTSLAILTAVLVLFRVPGAAAMAAAMWHVLLFWFAFTVVYDCTTLATWRATTCDALRTEFIGGAQVQAACDLSRFQWYVALLVMVCVELTMLAFAPCLVACCCLSDDDEDPEVEGHVASGDLQTALLLCPEDQSGVVTARNSYKKIH